MANKERNKRSARKARAQERADREAIQADAASDSQTKVSAKSEMAKAETKAKANKRPGFIKRSLGWFGDVRTEMRRVTWPAKPELKNYTVGVFAMLIVFGIAIWAIDLGIVALLSAYAGLGA
ncbi:preprotein translocase subunit SecE [Atopobium fossor]|uniref:preprotein translocase subunit SecE n=1 Tax=Atopobium fossor TaxID=39487 RepID=UPI000421FACD|nr:preprotein translocase subunit SecE [Atopobium fossor]